MTEPVLKGNETNIPIAPEFFVRDISSSVRFYDGLGFAVTGDYGLRDFIAADPDGYLLRFAAPIER